MPPVLEVKDLKKHYPVPMGFLAKAILRAVDGVSFSVHEGETLGLVGESGSGKSTVAKCILRLEQPTAGRIILEGQDITRLNFNEVRPLRRNMQMVFQDPYGSLNPRLRVLKMVAEPLMLHALLSPSAARRRAAELLNMVGLEQEHATRYPHELSGGQQQRVGVARAMSTSPRLVVLDEPTASLDVSVQALLLNLLRDLQRDFGLTFLFISHDLSVVGSLSSRVAVMYLGKIVEIGPTDQVFAKPLHPYTQALIAAVPVSHPLQQRTPLRLTGEIPSAVNPPRGCKLVGRCPFAMPICEQREPELLGVTSRHSVACYLYSDRQAEQGQDGDD